jgi:hypothetical protein
MYADTSKMKILGALAWSISMADTIQLGEYSMGGGIDERAYKSRMPMATRTC